MSHGCVGASLTRSFLKSQIWSKGQLKRVCPTRIRCALATYACSIQGMNQGEFAKHFMKNMEETTALHHNMYANHREALRISMQIGSTFHVGGEIIKVDKEEIDAFTTELRRTKISKEVIIDWIECRNQLSNKEMEEFKSLLSIYQTDAEKTKNFYGNNQVSRLKTEYTFFLISI